MPCRVSEPLQYVAYGIRYTFFTCLAMFLACVRRSQLIFTLRLNRATSLAIWKRFLISLNILLWGGTQSHNCTQLEKKKSERWISFCICYCLNCERISTGNNSWQWVCSWRGWITMSNLFTVSLSSYSLYTPQPSSTFLFLSLSQFHSLVRSFYPQWLLDNTQQGIANQHCCKDSFITFGVGCFGKGLHLLNL